MKSKVGIFLAALLAVIAVFLCAEPSWAAMRVAQFTIGYPAYGVEGREFPMDVAPYIGNGRTYVPVRYLAYALGVRESDVMWYPETGQVTICGPPGCKTCSYIQLWVDSNTLVINYGLPSKTKKVVMDVTPVLVDGRVMLPARWVAEAFGATVEWDPEYQRVTISLAAIPPTDQIATNQIGFGGGVSAPTTPLPLPNATLPEATVGQWYSYTFRATGGVPPYRYEWPEGAFPGLAMSTEGTISGVLGNMSPGIYVFTVTVTDATGAKASNRFELTVRTGAAPEPATDESDIEDITTPSIISAIREGKIPPPSVRPEAGPLIRPEQRPEIIGSARFKEIVNEALDLLYERDRED